MVNLCLETGAVRIQAKRILEAERERDSVEGAQLRAAAAQKRTPPADVVVKLLKREIDRAPTNNIIVEGFPSIVSDGFPGVQDQIDALQGVGETVKMVLLD